MKEHDLKILPEFFEAHQSGRKTFEVRQDDRGYMVGDTLILNEWNGLGYTGRSMAVEVTYISEYGQYDGWVVMSVR